MLRNLYSQLSPVRQYRLARYPAARPVPANRWMKTFGRVATALFAVVLGVFRRSDAGDTAQWTYDAPIIPPGVRHPIHGIYYATACFSGPVWDPVRLHRTVPLNELGMNPAIYRNDLIKTRGVLTVARPAPLDENTVYQIVDPETGFGLYIDLAAYWGYDRKEEESLRAGIGKEVEVTGELKMELKRFITGLDGCSYRTVWSIGESDVRYMKFRILPEE